MFLFFGNGVEDTKEDNLICCREGVALTFDVRTAIWNPMDRPGSWEHSILNTSSRSRPNYQIFSEI